MIQIKIDISILGASDIKQVGITVSMANAINVESMDVDTTNVYTTSMDTNTPINTNIPINTNTPMDIDIQYTPNIPVDMEIDTI